MPLRNVVSASDSVPLSYRLLLTVVEPLFAVNGAILVLLAPERYLSTVTRHGGTFAAESTFLYTLLGGAWLYFAFVEAVVMRACDDVRLWRLLCAGMLVSDVAFCHSAAQAVGGWTSWADLSAWTLDDHLVLWATVPFLVVRVLVVLGIGVGPRDKGPKSE
ncbi:hypothetical protein X797_008477 [Metarhizium robertsii]|uniref:DUF7704 domain-containing protein n=2 Tax=Metarhizium robertsii TaxID=568076 RepID=E9F7X4_METRA|nr:uncharacterized protein MAA_08373 [Metarhizium robertsii ARSEF 23]EFY96262.1 hypothetical protein MAA_08373 [Metarhizium robertsii ARSEF 23]EXU98529.1 hypothetical protein X797_008477 [Metarhizium robertsii]